MHQNISSISFFSVIFLVLVVSPQYSFGETLLPTIDTVRTNPPTYCVILPSNPEIYPNVSQDFALQFVDAVNLWSQKLIAENPDNEKNWIMKSIIFSEFEFKKNLDKCDIPVKMELEIRASGYFCPDTNQYWERCGAAPKDGADWIVVHMSRFSLPIILDSFFDTSLHEIGHSLGLDHAKNNSDPSVMGKNPDVIGRITQMDVDSVKSIYGEKGFFAFNTPPASSTPSAPSTPYTRYTPSKMQTGCGIDRTCYDLLASPGESVTFFGIAWLPNNDVASKDIPGEIIIEFPDKSIQKLEIPVSTYYSGNKILIYNLDFPWEFERGEYKITEYYKNQEIETKNLKIGTN